MDAKKCDRCGSFYIRKALKNDNAVNIFDKQVFGIRLIYRGINCDSGLDVDLCPKCMNDLKIFMEVQTVTPYIAKLETEDSTEDPCKNCVTPHCEQCR